MFVIREAPEWSPGVPLPAWSGHLPPHRQPHLLPGFLPDCGGEGHQGVLLQLPGVAQHAGLQSGTLARPRTIPGPRVAPGGDGGGEKVSAKQLLRSA